MKHLIPFRIYEAQTTSGLTKRQEQFLNKYTFGTWSVNPSTGLVDVQGDFNCSNERLESLLDISFGHVSGNFYCFNNQLTSLEGAPQTVSGHFFCSRNQLTSLKGSPQTVDGHFYCYKNKLTSLEGAPQTVYGDFRCYNNQLTSLEGAPQTVGGYFSCYNNQLTSLEGAPQTVGGYFTCDEFQLDKGKWNMEGWLEVLNTGKTKAKKLIATLPVFQPDWWNSKLKEDPKATTLQMVPIWDDLPSNIQDQIQIPSNLKDGFESLLDLQKAGIF